MDSIYTPVLKVNYTVDRTRVGQITDFDKLIMEVWTDGTCNAQEALSLAARVLTEHLNLFVNLCDETAARPRSWWTTTTRAVRRHWR